MKTNKLTATLFAALTLAALTATLVLAAPPEPGQQAGSAANAPIPQRSYLQAHSDAWHDYYFDKNVLPQPKIHTEYVPSTTWRGGLAEQQSQRVQNAVPKVRAPGVQAHSEEWNDYYFDRFVNPNIPARTSGYVSPLKWQGGMAKGATNGE